MYDEEKARLLEIALNLGLANINLKEEIEKLYERLQELERQVKTDNLTGLYNRKIAEEAYIKAGTVIMCDIDDFKILNDRYGHNFGDIVLKTISGILVKSVGQTDYVIRWGGEEFVMFIRSQNLVNAERLAEKIRNKVETLEGRLLEDGTVCPRITMSFGVAGLHNGSSINDDIHKADVALYQSKTNGKNSVTVSDSIEASKTLIGARRLG